MTKELIFHEHTAQAISDFLANPVHAVQLNGPPGCGKTTTAAYIASELLSIRPESLTSHSYVKIVSADDASKSATISIDSVRDVQKFLMLKIPSSHAVSRVVIVHNAHMMTNEAQNSLLKTLEEPPSNTVIILTSIGMESVLPTIRSRVRHISVLKPNIQKVQEYFIQQGYVHHDIKKATLLSGGLMGMTSALLADDQTHPLVTATVHARGILQSKIYERLLLVDGVSKQKELTINILYVLSQMAQISLTKSQDAATTERWQRVLRATYDAEEQLSYNAQQKLILMNLMMSI